MYRYPFRSTDKNHFALLREDDMANTGEDREIRQRVNAKEAEVISESKKLLEKVKSTKDRNSGGLRDGKKKGIVPRSR